MSATILPGRVRGRVVCGKEALPLDNETRRKHRDWLRRIVARLAQMRQQEEHAER
jgi:hypothetical protein